MNGPTLSFDHLLAGFGGVVYQPRFTGGAMARALALFGGAGRPAPLPPTGESRSIRDVLIRCGVEAVDTPLTVSAILPAATPPPPL